MLIHTAAKAIARVWFSTSPHSWRQLPRPTGPATVHTPGINPDRLIVLGSGAVVGYGVLDWELSISGRIAQQVSAITGRGIDMDVVADPNLDITSAQEVFRRARVARYDGILFMLGSIETIQLFPVRRWRRELGDLLDTLRDQAPASMRVFVVGIPPMNELVHLPALARLAIGARGRRFNEVSQELLRGREGMVYIPLDPPTQDLVKNAGSVLHAEWAGLIAPTVAAALERDAPRPEQPVDEQARLEALRALTVDNEPADEDLQQLVETARDVFNAAGASFDLVDADRHLTKAVAGIAGNVLAASWAEALSAATVRQPGLTVVPDMTRDARYRAEPWVTATPALRFFAGYPVEAPDGHLVGSLSIVDTKPRDLSNAEATLLREFALRVQHRLWERAGARPRLFGG